MDPRDMERCVSRSDYYTVIERPAGPVIRIDRDSLADDSPLRDAEGNAPEYLELPARYEVCTLCDGRGRHVNPSIDAHGISGDEFAEDPDFAAEYMGGTYDVDCYRCSGRRVEAVVDEARCSPELLAVYEQLMRDLAEHRREVAHQERYGY